MRELGAQLPESAMNHPGPLAMVLLHNAGKAPTIIAGTRNFYALTRYNQSSYYALAVIELGQAVSQAAMRGNQ
jgi:membrane-bound lytic murein transglycosylase B